jgi:hypothetical protein
MKYTFLFIALLIVFTTFSKDKGLKSEPAQEIYITIIDDITKETLVGVKNGSTYSNLDGKIKVNKGEEVSLEFISYEKLNTIVKNDTIIKMSSIK